MLMILKVSKRSGKSRIRESFTSHFTPKGKKSFHFSNARKVHVRTSPSIIPDTDTSFRTFIFSHNHLVILRKVIRLVKLHISGYQTVESRFVSFLHEKVTQLPVTINSNTIELRISNSHCFHTPLRNIDEC